MQQAAQVAEMQRTHSFGCWLRRRRKALDFTQAQLAERVNCSVGLIQKLEADARRLSRQLASSSLPAWASTLLSK